MRFTRLLEFCSTVSIETPQDDFRIKLPLALKQAPQAFEPYEQSLEKLEVQIWEEVKKKLLRRTTKHLVRGWAQFYDTLSEVRGFCYLLDSGYTNVHFIPEDNKARKPDIEATSQNSKCLLESKSIGFSNEERKYILENTRRLGSGQTLITRNVVQGMPQGLKDKIENTVKDAKEQLLNYLPNDNTIKRIVYLTLHLDIHMLLDMQNYTEVVSFVRRIILNEKEVAIVLDSLSSV